MRNLIKVVEKLDKTYGNDKISIVTLKLLYKLKCI